jgi:hypothetical protein
MCPACAARRLHASEEWEWHPYARHGYAAGQGWTHPDIDPGAAPSLGKSSGEVLVEVTAAPVGD